MKHEQTIFTKPLGFAELDDLPNSHYWKLKSEDTKYFSSDAQKEFMTGNWFGDQLNLTRHLFVNGVPLYFLSLSIGLPMPRWIRSAFCTLEQCLANVSSSRMEGRTVEHVEFIPIAELNKLHRSYDAEGNETIHDYTNWVHHFGGQYEGTPRLVFSDLTEEDKEKYLPEESRHLLCKPLS